MRKGRQSHSDSIAFTNKRVLLIMAATESAEKDERVELKPENVREDPDLSKMEKETTIRFPKDRDHAVLFSAEGPIVRNSIRHPHVQIESHNVHEGSITSVRATLPIGLLLVKAEPRNDPGHSRVFAQSTLKDTNDEDS